MQYYLNLNNPVLFIYFCHRKPKSETTFLALKCGKTHLQHCRQISQNYTPGPPLKGTERKRTVGGRQDYCPQTLTNTRIEQTWDYQYHQYHQSLSTHSAQNVCFPRSHCLSVQFTIVGIISSESTRHLYVYIIISSTHTSF